MEQTMSSENGHPRILVVEDDADQRELICEVLAAHYADGQAGDGRPARSLVVGVGSAAECLAQDLTGFDIVLQDYHLPDSPGIALLEKILERVDLPVLFVTGDNLAATALEALRRGAQDYVVKLGDYLFTLPVLVDKNIRQHQTRKENKRLQQQLQGMLEQLRVKNVQLEESTKKLRTMATTDHLTGLANRRRFARIMERRFREAARYEFDLTCCMCDLDHYKEFNDTLGHQAGDRLLTVAAEVIRESLRGADTAARYGGDEFVLLLPHISVAQATVVTERIRRKLARRGSSFGSVSHPVTMSVGLASLASDRPAGGESLLNMADKALYVAKERGRDCVVSFGEIRAGLVPSLT